MTRARDSLTDRFFLLFGGLQIFGAFSAGRPRELSAYVVVSVALIALALWERRSLKGFDSKNSSALITAPKVIEIGQVLEIPIQIVVNGSATGTPGVVRCEPPRSSLLRSLSRGVLLPKLSGTPGAVYEGAFRFQGEALGREKLENIDTVWISGLGFWARQLSVKVQPVWEVRVIPSRQAPSPQTLRQLMGRQALLNQGRRQLLRDQFRELVHSIRDYQFPDSLKNVDQKKSAKFGKLKTRVYESLHEHHLVIALDVGRSLAGSLKGSSKLDYYLSAALALAEMAISSGDSVSFVAYAQETKLLIKRARSIRTFKPLLDGVASLRAQEEESDYSRLPAIVQSLTGQRSIVLLLSDLSRPSVQDLMLNPVKALSQQHLVLLMSLLDRELGLERAIMETDLGSRSGPLEMESYNRLIHAYSFRESVDTFRAKVGRAGAAVVLAPENEWVSSCVRLYSRLRDSVRI